MKNFASIRKFENAHIALWLLKDTCWCFSFKTAGVLMIIPTIFMALYISWKSKHLKEELFHNLAVVCWICANSIWMISEFYFDEKHKSFALFFFILGLSIMAYYYLFLFKKQE